jgi:hypothetical protein
VSQEQEWIVTKYDEVGEPLLRERKPIPELTPTQKYEHAMDRCGEAML